MLYIIFSLLFFVFLFLLSYIFILRTEVEYWKSLDGYKQERLDEIDIQQHRVRMELEKFLYERGLIYRNQ